MTARLLNCSESEYFAGPCDVPSLSQSCAHTLLTKSPLHAWNDHPKLGRNRQADETQAKDDGTLIHKFILGKGADVAVIKANDWRTNAAKAERDEARASGKVPVLEHHFATAMAAALKILDNLKLHGIKFDGASEVAIEWDEEGEHGPVRCHGKFDHLNVERGVILDLKKARNAHPKLAARSMIDYGADIQHAAYTSALEKLKPEFAGRTDFIFLFAELDPPYAVLPARPDGAMRELGSSRWMRAVHIWERCLQTNHWPSYSEGIASLSPPPWAMTEEMGNDW